MNERVKFEVRSFTRSSRCGDDRGLQKIWAVPGNAHAPFSPFFHGILSGWTLLLFWPNLKFVALSVPEIIAIGVLGGVRTPILGKWRP